VNKGKGDGGGGGRKEERREMANEGCTQRGGKTGKKKKGRVGQAKLDRRDGTAPSIEGYI
jgi:hypothetical protein